MKERLRERLVIIKFQGPIHRAVELMRLPQGDSVEDQTSAQDQNRHQANDRARKLEERGREREELKHGVERCANNNYF